MTENKVKSYIGFAIKAGKVIFGADNILLSRKDISLILLSESINQSSKHKLISYAESKGITLIIKSETTLENIITRQGCKALAILDKNLSAAIIENIGVGVNE